MKIVFFPEPGYVGKLWDVAPNDWQKPTLELKRQLEAEGHDVFAFPDEVKFDVKDKDVAAVYFDVPEYQAPVIERSVLVVLEPPIVKPRTYERLHGWPFERILTFAKDYVDNKRIFYSPYPVVRYAKDLSHTKKDKYICAISSGNKNFPGGLYEARRLAYLGFGKDLDLYGWGWEKDAEIMDTVNYKGPCEDKVAVLAAYKHAIVFENWVGNGYCSEKFWDAIQAQTIPIYRGWWPDYKFEDATEEAWAKRIVGHLKEIK